MTKLPQKPGLWWAAFDDGDKVTEIVLLEVAYFIGLKDFEEGAVFRVLDGSGRDGIIDGDMAQPLICPSWDIVLGHRTRATVDQVRLTWLREQHQPKLKVAVGDRI